MQALVISYLFADYLNSLYHLRSSSVQIKVLIVRTDIEGCFKVGETEAYCNCNIVALFSIIIAYHRVLWIKVAKSYFTIPALIVSQTVYWVQKGFKVLFVNFSYFLKL